MRTSSDRVGAEVRADRVVPRDRLAQLVLVGERQTRDLAEPAGVGRTLDPGLTELLAIERRTVEKVAELRPIARVVDRDLLLPGPGLDLRLEHHASGGS